MSPVYEYRCQQCNNTFEVRQKIHDSPLTDCLECGGELQRVIHASRVIYNAPGFHATDSKKEADFAKEEREVQRDRDKAKRGEE